jgi:lupus La protein
VEYYFSDANFPKDKYLQSRCGSNPERYINLRDIMSFNKMRKLTQSWEQVVRAL